MIKTLQYPFFIVQSNNSIGGGDLRNLRKFYAPILGSECILLYEYLRDLSFEQSSETGFYDFDSLTYLLNMDIDELNQARIKLESVSLVTTLLDQYNRKTVFIIEKPLDRNGLKRNLILANKLIKIMGKQNFDRLIGKEKNICISKAGGLLDASAKFDDVFETDFEFDVISTPEIDSTDLETKEINNFIQQKLDLNTFEYPNPYEAILKTDARFFFSQISGQIPTTKIIDLIKFCRASNFNDPCINLVFFYSYEINSRINYGYVKKILIDLMKKQINSFEAIENYLDDMVKFKNDIVISKKELYKATYLQSLTKHDHEEAINEIDD